MIIDFYPSILYIGLLIFTGSGQPQERFRRLQSGHSLDLPHGTTPAASRRLCLYQGE